MKKYVKLYEDVLVDRIQTFREEKIELEKSRTEKESTIDNIRSDKDKIQSKIDSLEREVDGVYSDNKSEIDSLDSKDSTDIPPSEKNSRYKREGLVGPGAKKVDGYYDNKEKIKSLRNDYKRLAADIDAHQKEIDGINIKISEIDNQIKNIEAQQKIKDKG